MVKAKKIPTLLTFFLDIIIVNLSVLLAVTLYSFIRPQIKIEPEQYLSCIPLLSFLSGCIFWIFGLYADWKRKDIKDLVIAIVLSTFGIVFIIVAFTFFGIEFSFAYGVYVIFSFVQIILMTPCRLCNWYIGKKSYGPLKVLIITQDQEAGSVLANKILQYAQTRFIVKGFFTAHELSTIESNLSAIDVVLINTKISRKSEIVTLCTEYGKEVLVVPELSELLLWGADLQQIDDLLVLSIKPRKLCKKQLFLKRVFDIFTSIILLALSLPVIIILFIVIPLSTEGPALYKQERVGINQKKFLMYKFRSMNLDAEKECGPVLATDNDSRITKIGHFLRSTRLDEIPQFVNVLIGQMSLVGPRPERPFFVNQFEQSIPYYRYRMSIRPGITGLAQVMGKYNTTVEDKMRFDMMYIRNYSFVLDLKILFQTFIVVFKRQQAVGKVTSEHEHPKSLEFSQDGRSV